MPIVTGVVRPGTRQRLKNLFGRDKKQEPESHVQSTPSTPRSSNPLTSTVPSSSTSSDAVTTSQHESLKGKLWNKAYDDLKDEEAELVEAYEKLLSRELGGGDLDSSHNNEGPTNVIAQTNSEERKLQMKQIVESGLKKTEKEASVKSGIEEKTRVLASMKVLITEAVKSSPEASLAWAGVCFCITILGNPISESSANRDGVAYVSSRMKWYWELSGLLEERGNGTTGLRGELENHIVQLYKNLFSYQMKSVCLYYRNRGVTFLRDMIKLDGWEGTLHSLKSAENVVQQDYTTYNFSNMATDLNGLLEATHSECNILRDFASFFQQEAKAKQERRAEEKKEREEEKQNQYLIDLGGIDPRNTKDHIVNRSGGFLPEISNWILGHPSFKNWRENDESQLLWIKGDPGKGKTMLLIAIINELERSLAEVKHPEQQTPPLLVYFFCLGTDSNLNSATAVIRGLIYRFLEAYSPLTSHYKKGCGSNLDQDALYALSHVLQQILKDERLPQTYVVIDALDECKDELEFLLDFIFRNFSDSNRIKWIISSRIDDRIEDRIDRIDRIESQSIPEVSKNRHTVLQLSDNQEQISDAVKCFIEYNVDRLFKLNDNDPLRDQVLKKMQEKADGTFLWVALACNELRIKTTKKWHLLNQLDQIPSELNEAYGQILGRILPLDRDRTNWQAEENYEFCRLVLSTITLAYRPLDLEELAVVSGLKPEMQGYVRDLVQICSSMFTIQEDRVSPIHETVKEFLMGKTAKERIFPSGLQATHLTISLQSLKAMQTLKRNVYNVSSPGTENSKFKASGSDPLISMRYSCVHWISHFCNGYRKAEIGVGDDDNRNGSLPISLSGVDAVKSFFENCFLHWVEALGILRQMGTAIVSMKELEHMLRKWNPENELVRLLYDCRRFALNNIRLIETTPLQTYVSALFFSPTSCKIRKIKKYQDEDKKYEGEEPKWVTIKPNVDDAWSPCLQTLEGHKHHVMSVAFSHDSKLLASGSYDRTVKIWDAANGAFQESLNASTLVLSVAFSPDSRLLAAGCRGSRIRVWDTATRTLQYVLRHHENDFKEAEPRQRKSMAEGLGDDINLLSGYDEMIEYVQDERILSVAFSSDSSLLASGSNKDTIAIWDCANHQLRHTLSGHNGNIESLVFFPNSYRLVSGSRDGTIKIWDAANGELQQTLTDNEGCVKTVAFSPNSEFLASGSDRGTTIWDTKSWIRNNPEAHEGAVNCVKFSPDGKFLASASRDKKAKIWDATSWSLQQTFHSDEEVSSLAFSSDSKIIALGTFDNKIKIWDTETRNDLKRVSQYHDDCVFSVTFSQDLKLLASTSGDQTIKVWNVAKMTVIHTLRGHETSVISAIFSSDSKLIASVSIDRTIKVWDTQTGDLRATLEGPALRKQSVAFSQDGRLLAACNIRTTSTIKIWEVATSKLIKSIESEKMISRVSFDETGMFLNTNHGRFNISDGSRLPEVGLLPHPQDDQREIGWGINEKGDWITWNNDNRLWLPPDYRSSEVTELIESPAATLIAIGTLSGRVSVIELPSSGPLD